MNLTSLLMCLCLHATCGTMFSESRFDLREIQQKDFAKISVEDARVIAFQASRSGIGINADAFVQAAIKSGRMELISLCWEDNYIASIFQDTFLRMPENHLRDRLFSMYFRSNKHHWPDENETLIYSGNQRFSMTHFYVPILRKYNPELALDYSILNSREKRLKLADAYDTAAGIPIVVEPEAKRVWPPPPGQHHPGSPPPSQSQVTDRPVVATSTAGEGLSIRGGSFVWLGAGMAILAVAAGWMLARLRRGKR